METLVLDTKLLRQRLGDISQAELAQIAHVDQSAVSLWENDINAPRCAAAAWISQYCKSKGVAEAWKPAPVKGVGAKRRAPKPKVPKPDSHEGDSL